MKYYYLLIFLGVFYGNAQLLKESAAELGIEHYALDNNAMSGGVLVFDFNNDGFDDIFLIGGAKEDKLYENLGGNKFIEVTDKYGLKDPLHEVKTMGVVGGDIDNDGYIDLFVTTAENHHCYLFKNIAGKYFTDISASAGIEHMAWSTTATMTDYDLDGDLDIYVGNYVTYDGLPYSDHIINDESDFFYENNGDETFKLKEAILDRTKDGATLVTSFSDIDLDGDSDIFMLNDFGEFHGGNKLFLNNIIQDTFEDVSELSNLDIEINSMGIATADVDQDGDLDHYITNIDENYLFFKNSDVSFKNVTEEFGVVGDGGFSWGTSFLDVNNDSYLDLFVARGSILKQFSPQENILFLFNNNSQTFEDVSVAQGLNDVNRGRGVTHLDFNNDGQQELIVGVTKVIPSNEGKTLVYRNTNNSENNWMEIVLEGVSSNKSAYGSFVKLYANDRVFVKELSAGASYLSSHSNVLHFGLNDIALVDKIEVYWPGLKKEIFENINSNFKYKIIEGDGIYKMKSHFINLCQGEEVEVDGTTKNENEIITKITKSNDGIGEIKITRIYITPDESCDDSNEDENENKNYSIAREWNELLLESIRKDYARPTVHARNLWHISMAMYEAWAAYEKHTISFFFNNKEWEYSAELKEFSSSEEKISAQRKAISFACYRLLTHRFRNSPGFAELKRNYESLMQENGFEVSNVSSNYESGDAAALGNYIAEEIIKFGLIDGSNESNDYANQYYKPLNSPLVVDQTGNPNLVFLNNWQPLTLSIFIDQSGNVTGDNTPEFLSPEWGNVVPFSLKDKEKIIRDKKGIKFNLYHDPGYPVKIDKFKRGISDPYKWGFSMVATWSSHLDPNDGEKIDISPSSLGNIAIVDFPKDFEGYKRFYNLLDGGDIGKGYIQNPFTKQPYQKQIVARGDYARVLAEFWADGPDSETPPGHWFTILNYVNDNPVFVKKWRGKGRVLDDLEWDVKSYFTLGGALHDAAITAWSVKGYYDYIRPISAIRYMASKGQSSDPNKPNYHKDGIPLIPDFIELITSRDKLVEVNPDNLGKIKIKAWRGSKFLTEIETEEAGVDWILGEDWIPYQRPSFVTPPFAGYVSGHSTFSRAAAEVMSLMTGDKFFPGGLGTFDIEKNEYLVFENGPSQDLQLQWATYQDASDQCSLSRIWGGIHPPIDDVPGRLMGYKVGVDAFNFANKFFSSDVHKLTFTKNQSILSPNPVEKGEYLELAFKEYSSSKMILEIFNLNGKKVHSKEIYMDGNNIVKTSTSNLDRGIFILIIRSQNSILKHQKIIVN